ncbi:MAG: hypothetical protein U0230_05390 [Polyangiales bacterium]
MRTQSRFPSRRLSALTLFLALGMAIAAVLPTAAAQGGLRATIYLVQGNVPRNLPTVQQLLRYARSHQARSFQEITDKPIRERRWDGTLVISFNRPLGDLEYSILFYDVTGGASDFISPPMNVMVNNRQETTFVQPVHLERPRFRPNRDLEIRVTVRRQEVGKARTRLVGEVEQVNNELDFTQPDPEHPTGGR